MALWNALPISRKLPLVIATLCVVASVSVAIVSYLDFRRNIFQQSQESLEVLTESRADALVTWFENLGGDVSALGRDPTVVSAVNAFNSSFNLMIDSAGLQQAYIANNPHPVGQKQLLDQAPESIPYHFQHGQFHPFFRQIKETVGYYDIFLFNLNGDLMYSVFKEPDYATNFVEGAFNDTGLAQAFLDAREGTVGQVYFADYAPYAPSGGAAASFLATPVSDTSDRIIGVVAVQVPSGQINAIMNNPVGLGDTGEVYTVGQDQTTRSHSRFDGGYRILDDVSVLRQANAADMNASAFIANTTGIGNAPVLAKAAPIEVFDQRWGIVGEIGRAEIMAPAIAARNKAVVLMLLVGALSSVMGWLIARSFVLPLDRLGAGMDQVSQKNYDISVVDKDRGDEIGRLSQALLTFRDRLQASDAAEEAREQRQAAQSDVVARLSTALTALASGQLTHRIEHAFPPDYEMLRTNFNGAVETLNETIGSVVGRASAIRQRADTMSQASDDLSRRTENQAATLEETAAAIDQLTASVKSAADGAKEVAGIVGRARSDAADSTPVVENAVQAMTQIEKSSDEIAQIISVIDDIAFQTNLLALNAGVEAARAGEAGRGFAVVASEVRALAQRSSDAAKQIKGLISQSSTQVEQGVSLVGQAGEVLTNIVSHINNISGLVEEIAAGAQEQSTGLGEINIGATQLDKVTQQNAAMVEEVTAGSHALNGDATQLTDLVKRFELEAVAPETVAVDNIASFVPKPAAAVLQQADTIADTSTPDTFKVAVGDSFSPAQESSDDIWQDF